MFGWLKRKQKNELWKLIYQNETSLEYHIAVCGEDGKNDPALFDVLETSNVQNESIKDTLIKYGKLGHEDTSVLLDINKMMRRLHDDSRFRMKSFDDEYMPLVGWEIIYERMENLSQAYK